MSNAVSMRIAKVGKFARTEVYLPEHKLWHEKPRQHPGRREHVHGRVHDLDCKCGGCNV